MPLKGQGDFWRWIGRIAACLTMAVALRARAATGLDWLATQQNADGSFGNTPASLATVPQTTAEVLTAYQMLGATNQAPFAPALSALNTDTSTNTEDLARLIEINAAQGASVDALVTELLANQNPSTGAFGDSATDAGDILDTAYALEALWVAGQKTTTPALHALDFTLSAQQSDGGFGDATNGSSVFVTALTTHALWQYRHVYPDAAAAIGRAQQYLLAQRDASGLWKESFDTALALIALAPSLPNISSLTTSIASLKAGQASDGSWDEDAYTTALALRAIDLVSLPQPNPDYATLSGSVIDAQTGLPLAGVSATLTGSTSATLVTGSDGRFVFTGLQAGSYGVALSLTDYAPLSVTTAVTYGQTLDLGTLPLIKASGATTGTIQGRVTDASTGQALGGVAISASGVAEPMTTAADGTYEISDVTPGIITLSASKLGYSTASGTATLGAGGVLLYSPSLTPGTSPAVGATVEGTVTAAVGGAPLAGVTITLAGANSASAQTDASGHYSLTGLNAGTTTLTATLSGYDTVTSGAVLGNDSTTTFSPALYASGTTPANANTSGVTGVVLDAGTNAPLVGASVTAVFGTVTESVSTDATGHFTITGFTAPNGSVSVSMSGYAGETLDIALPPLTLLDLGQIRLRPAQASQLLPDLVVSRVDHSAAPTDPHTLIVSGDLAVTVANHGTANAPSNVALLAFYDANRNGVYDSGDIVLGQATTASAIPAGGTLTVSLPVQGSLPFRDAPISVWVDSNQTVAELNENNNVNSTANACGASQAAVSAFNPVVKWRWSTTGTIAETPIIGPLIDTNGDGKIDQNDTPAVIVISDGLLYALNGKDGQVLWHSTTYTGGYGSTPALGDINGDGQPEIISFYGPKVEAFDNHGVVKWISSASLGSTTDYVGITLADLDGDGKSEIIAGNLVLNSDGSLRWAGDATNMSIATPVVADLDGDGKPEIIMGPNVYHADGTLYWKMPANLLREYVLSAVARLDPTEAYPDVISVMGSDGVSYLVVYNHDGSVKWGPVLLDTPYNGGAPLIADLDGDGKLEIGVHGATYYEVFNSDGSLKWKMPIHDGSTGACGSTAFDFNHTGRMDVVDSDEQTLHVFDGTTGQEIFTTPNPSATWVEMPVVADADHGGHADIVVQSNYGSINGVRAFENQNNDWPETRGIWNEYDYHVTNVNDDGSIPAHEQNSWDVYNTYRVNPVLGGNGLPDLTASLLNLVDNGTGNPFSITLRIGNGGSQSTPDNVPVNFYQGDPSAGGVLLGTLNLAALNPGDYRDVRLDNVTLTGSGDLFAVIDPSNTVTECSKTNNAMSSPATAVPGGTLSATTDAPSYGPGSPVAITATVANTGALPGTYSVSFDVEDSKGAVVAVLPPQSISTLNPGALQTFTLSWNTGSVLTGSYVLHGTLSAGGAVLNEIKVPFSIGSGTAASVTLRVTTDRAVYNTSDQVQINALIANNTANALVGPATVKLTVTDAGGNVVFTTNGALTSLPPGGLQQLSSVEVINGAAVATYTVTVQLLDASGALIAQGSAQYSVSANLAQSLTGTVTLATNHLEIGDTQTCSDTLTNGGTLALTGLSIAHVLVNLDTGSVANTVPATVDLASGASISATRSFATDTLPAGHYACLLQATINGAAQTVAFAGFALVEPPIRVGADVQVQGHGRLLVLMDAPTHCQEKDQTPLSGQANGQGGNEGGCRGGDDRDAEDSPEAPTLSAQRAFLETLLKSEGWSYTIVNDPQDFARELRTGGYAVYAILSERTQLDDTTERLLREAVFDGAGLLDAGAHDDRNALLDDALGVDLSAAGRANAVILGTNPWSLTGSLSTLSDDDLLGARLRGAQALASFSPALPPARGCAQTQDARPDDDCRPVYALTLDTYGLGQSTYAGFDLLATAAHDGQGSLAATLLSQLLSGIQPKTLPVEPGAVLPITVTLTNEGIATNATVTVLLPAGTSAVDPGAGTLSGNTFTFATSLALKQVATFTFWLRLPLAAGPLTLNATVTAGPQNKVMATPSLTLTVPTTPTLATLIATDQSLIVSGSASRGVFEEAAEALRAAQAAYPKDPMAAVDAALRATDALAQSTDPAAASLRQQIGQWIRTVLLTS